jgi:dihydroxy-acid dehydratase
MPMLRDVLIGDAELRGRKKQLAEANGYPYPTSQTPRQAIRRTLLGELESGAILEGAEKYRRIAQTSGLPRDNH